MAGYDPSQQYAEYMQAQNPDMSQGGDTWAGMPDQYKQMLQDAYKQKYGTDTSQPFDWSKFQRANADTLTGQAGFTSKVGGGLLGAADAYHQMYQAQKFDPNAYLEKVGEGPNMQYILRMDQSKLPKFAGGTQDMSKFGGWRSVDSSGGNNSEQANNPAYVVHDANYGDWTPGFNLKANPDDKMDSTWQGIDAAVKMAANFATGGASGLLFGVGDAINRGTNGGGWGGLGGMAANALGSYSGLPVGYMMQLAQMLKQQNKYKGGH